MTTKKPVRIRRIRLVEPAPFGLASIVEASIGTDSASYYGGSRIEISFDPDDRFVRVDIGGGVWSGLIPYSNIALIQLEPTPV